MGQAPGPQLSPDGSWWWDGAAWRPAVSADGRWRWTGYGWVATGSRLGGLPAPWVALIAGAVVVAIVAVTVPIALLISGGGNGLNPVGAISPRPSSTALPSTTIPCDQLEHTQVHYHAFLQIVAQGGKVGIPTDVGRKLGCYYWLHTHTNEAGIIHVESPADRTFTLGDFFDVWSAWGGVPQLLDPRHVATLTVGSGQQLTAYVDLDDGAGARAFAGNPRSIVLQDHEIITLEITPPAVDPPPAFAWPSGF